MCVDDFDWLWNFPLFNFSRHWEGIFLPNIFHSRRTHFKLTSRFFLSCRTTSSSVRYFHPVESKSEKSEEGTSELKWEILKWKEKIRRHEILRPVRKLAELRHWMETRTAQEKRENWKVGRAAAQFESAKVKYTKAGEGVYFYDSQALEQPEKTWLKSETQQSTFCENRLEFSFFFIFHVSSSHPTFNIIIIWRIFTDFFTFLSASHACPCLRLRCLFHPPKKDFIMSDIDCWAWKMFEENVSDGQKYFS